MKALSYLLKHSFIRFAAVGATGYFVNAGALAILIRYNVPVDAALALSIFIAMCFTWIGNRYLTFRERRAHGFSGILQEWLRFVGANLLGAVINYCVALALVHFASGWLASKFVAQALGVLAGLVFNFTLSKTMVFKAPR